MKIVLATIKPISAKHYTNDLKNSSQFYAQAVIIQILLKTISPDSQWARHVAQLMEEHPKVPIHRMGFPDNWQKHDVWFN